MVLELLGASGLGLFLGLKPCMKCDKILTSYFYYFELRRIESDLLRCPTSSDALVLGTKLDTKNPVVGSRICQAPYFEVI